MKQLEQHINTKRVAQIHTTAHNCTQIHTTVYTRAIEWFSSVRVALLSLLCVERTWLLTSHEFQLPKFWKLTPRKLHWLHEHKEPLVTRQIRLPFGWGAGIPGAWKSSISQRLQMRRPGYRLQLFSWDTQTVDPLSVLSEWVRWASWKTEVRACCEQDERNTQ
jgi:hypothetical protein